jgi:ABC-type transport system involved in multi-copper enzyme maturation permease subunit
VSLLRLSARAMAGRRYWLAPLLPLLWIAFQALRLVVGWQERAWEPAAVQNALLAFPVVVLAIGLGVRVVAGEIERRTLEIAYTVPGGAHRVWLARFASAATLVAVSTVLLAVVTHVLLVPVPLGAVLGAVQSALFYLAVAMAMAAWFGAEITGVLGCVVVLLFNGLITGFGSVQNRLSPFFNPLAAVDIAPSDLVAWTVQNRIGFLLATAAVVALACARAERREKLLG